MSTDLEQKLVYFGCLIVAIILHEISHGVVALFFGDDTAKRSGRLTLNPIPHIDPFGSIILPALLIYSTGTAFGWAKPVPVNPTKLRDPRRQMLWVGLAGPFTNFVLMTAAAVFARLMFENHPYSSWIQTPLVLQLALMFALVNLFLGVFNLLPVPPLDGSSLIERVLPEAWLPGWYRYRQYGFAVLFALLFFTNLFGRVIQPFEDALFRFILR